MARHPIIQNNSVVVEPADHQSGDDGADHHAAELHRDHCRTQETEGICRPTDASGGQPGGQPSPKFTSLRKVLFPSTGFTKGDLLDYHHRVAPLILPYLRGRPVTLNRYPSGIAGRGFFSKHCPRQRTSWLRTAVVSSSSEAIEYLLIEELASLLWVANLNAIELHVPLALAATPMTPTAIMLDLDPGPPAGLAEAARWRCGCSG